MQKVKKLVISTLMLFLLMIFNSYSQANKNDYILLNKVIELTKEGTDILYNLNEKVNTENFLKDYYDYRFFDRPFYSKFVYDKEKDSAFIDNDNKEIRTQRNLKWDKKCKVIDSLFSKNDIETFIKPRRKISYWKKNSINVTNVKFVETYYLSNLISKPYYRKDNKYALVLHRFRGTKTLFVFAKNDKSQWEYFSQVDNLWW
ncbi:hypothetical protein [uncultured Psychroserpens sp.]|uniref:hypothetical protein n=1 Tax=uncultured Psychroserpens sp. TaxID=255436 RepID=UPI0026246E90|nr:hypothetical protein [uncultured Psychroserpens sp.]